MREGWGKKEKGTIKEREASRNRGTGRYIEKIRDMRARRIRGT